MMLALGMFVFMRQTLPQFQELALRKWEQTDPGTKINCT